MASHSNLLIHENSPYLLQHAHNPVSWHAWNDETLQKARLEGKPLLISIGYAACHWCHVMERESFEDETIARFMNENFVNIKIDREERPDLDHIYMDAVQAMTGSGGWPLNAFATPEGKPFYGGTYFPPQKAYNRPSWMDVLTAIADAWKNRKADLENQADELISHIQKSAGLFNAPGILKVDKSESSVFTRELCNEIKNNLLINADTREGGFGKAPKFPQTFSIQFLLQHAHFFGDKESLKQAELTLQKMLKGGIYDQLAGGLSRYSTDDQWLAPHFEKMLYDNALFISALCDAYQLTGNKFYLEGIHKTLDFVFSEMQHKDGGYFAALDADSEGEEGKYYVWDKDEIINLLGEDNAEIFSYYFGVSAEGNWEHKNILHIKYEKEIVAAKFGITTDELVAIIEKGKTILFNARAKRIRPQTDDKIILGWNALLLTAFCKAYACSGDEKYKEAAMSLFSFIETCFTQGENGALFHTYKEGNAKYPAFLDDYSFLIEASIYLQEISGNPAYLFKARRWMEFVLENFSSENDKFYYTGKNQLDVVLRKKEVYDSALPSSNAVLAGNLIYLGIVFDERNWIMKGQNLIKTMAEVSKKYPGSFARWATLLQVQAMGIQEIAITGTVPGQMLKDVLEIFIPNKVLVSHNKEVEMPLLKQKSYSEDALVYLCKNYECQLPLRSKSGVVDALKFIPVND